MKKIIFILIMLLIASNVFADIISGENGLKQDIILNSFELLSYGSIPLSECKSLDEFNKANLDLIKQNTYENILAIIPETRRITEAKDFSSISTEYIVKNQGYLAKLSSSDNITEVYDKNGKLKGIYTYYHITYNDLKVKPTKKQLDEELKILKEIQKFFNDYGLAKLTIIPAN